ncbi:uncharacterized protein G2W53_015118 [Senna tora]|uniref:Uncharacterized protein n=1 Tax=Senna tora TaxID=362788 RepID=A0A835C701_9FABA|nr:uncharacterized protein G2W53_015118 [Senna tora]
MSMSSTGDSTGVAVPATVIAPSSQRDQTILELPVLCPQIIDPAFQPQQPSDPPQISLDPDLNWQTNQTLDSARPLQVYSRRKAPPPTSEPVQSSPSEPQDVEVIDSSSPHIHDYDVPIALRKGGSIATGQISRRRRLVAADLAGENAKVLRESEGEEASVAAEEEVFGLENFEIELILWNVENQQ